MLKQFQDQITMETRDNLWVLLPWGLRKIFLGHHGDLLTINDGINALKTLQSKNW